MSIRPGLVSVTFRQLEPRRVVALAQRAGLAGVEWGGDVHVPHGDLAAAEEVAALTARAGLAVSAYGSYYRLGESPDAPQVVATAARLGAPVIRVWAGSRASADADEDHRARVRDDALRLAASAAAEGIGIVLEYHRGTLTDTRDSTAALLAAVPGSGIRSLWQPNPERDAATNAADLEALLPDLANLHVFAWRPDHSRLPLHDHREQWSAWLAVAAAAPGDRYASLEFVAGDDPAQAFADATTLHDLLSPHLIGS
ncbi:TIM barrel protein [Actinoplanes sp. NPDC049548]|uniref:sugar phosphate isomerase/epimerase family protein n=1 Tax=Actinoplanes sp. NPDC049548 TaxID=3155152 RepID=UPI003412C66A